MRVVMTGGGGFIGSHLLARMVGAGIDVTLLGPNTGKSRYTESLVAAGTVRLLRCAPDFGNESVLRLAVDDADALVLLGYVLPTATGPVGRLLEEFKLNVEPLVRLLRVACDRPRHVVFASSVSVYGTPERVPVAETEPERPCTAYGIAKLACEQVVRISSASAGGTTSVLRYATVYGPGETVPRAIPNFIRAALAGEPPLVAGDGLDERDYVHVADVAQATMRALERRADGTFNIGSGRGTRTIDLARLVLQLTGAKVDPLFRPSRLADHGPVRMFCDTARAREVLGFVAHDELSAGISEEIGWFRSQLASTPAHSLAATA
jgi:UDP-glucose 4-epimerase